MQSMPTQALNPYRPQYLESGEAIRSYILLVKFGRQISKQLANRAH